MTTPVPESTLRPTPLDVPRQRPPAPAGTRLAVSLEQSRALAPALLLATADAVRLARLQGRSWADIGQALGVSRQSAWERWRHLDGAGVGLVLREVDGDRVASFRDVHTGSEWRDQEGLDALAAGAAFTAGLAGPVSVTGLASPEDDELVEGPAVVDGCG